MVSRVNRLIFGRDVVTYSDVDDLLYRHKFSKYLPYRAYDPDTYAYHNMDQSIGYLWECIPLVYADEQVFGLLSGFLNQAFPENTVLQFILYADPYIKPILDRYRSLKVRQTELSRRSAESTVDFFQKGTKGVDKLQGIPIRNYRLFVSLKMPKSEKLDEYSDIRNGVYETLKGIHLYPRPMEPKGLINFLGRMFNETVPELNYKPEVLINEQILLSETPVEIKFDHVKIGEKYWRCQTVKQMADNIEGLTSNFLSGDIWGVTSDGNQITNPFLMTVNVIFQNLSSKLHRKCNFVLQQKAFGSLTTTLVNKQSEYSWATGELERGVRFLRIMPIVWHRADTNEASKQSAARVKRIWQSRSFVPQEDRGILQILFLSAMPFGLYTEKKSVEFIERDFICQPEVAARMLPIQVDFMGGGDPHCLFVGRKGQMITLDLFFRGANNSNAMIAATTGAGKSFLMNTLVFNYHSSGALVRIIDIGKSYVKMCNIVGGKLIQFSEDSSIVMNPFSNIINIGESIQTVSAVIAQMVFSTSRKLPTETEMTLIKSAIENVYRDYGREGSIDKVYQCLANPSKSLKEVAELEGGAGDSFLCDLKRVSTELAFNLRNFTRSGEYGRWFNGPATLNVTDDEFIVLELEELKRQPELFNVVTLQLLDTVTAGLYLSDRSKKQMIIFDEAWQFFSQEGNKQGGQTSLLARVIESGYRRARKYGGSFITICQSLLDFDMFGDIGQVIMSNSAYKFYLQSADFEKAQSKNLINYDRFSMSILKSITSPKPHYSEVFMDTPLGVGVARLVVDLLMYFISTSDAFENNVIHTLVNQGGYSYAEAFEHMIEQCRYVKEGGIYEEGFEKLMAQIMLEQKMAR